MADPTDPGIDYKAIASTFYNVVLTKVAGYLKDHEEAAALLLKWSEQLGLAMFKRLFTSDPGALARLDEEINDYKTAMMEEADAVIVDAEGLAKSTFLTVLDTAWSITQTLAPVIFKLATGV